MFRERSHNIEDCSWLHCLKVWLVLTNCREKKLRFLFYRWHFFVFTFIFWLIFFCKEFLCSRFTPTTRTFKCILLQTWVEQSKLLGVFSAFRLGILESLSLDIWISIQVSWQMRLFVGTEVAGLREPLEAIRERTDVRLFSSMCAQMSSEIEI